MRATHAVRTPAAARATAPASRVTVAARAAAAASAAGAPWAGRLVIVPVLFTRVVTAAVAVSHLSSHGRAYRACSSLPFAAADGNKRPRVGQRTTAADARHHHATTPVSSSSSGRKQGDASTPDRKSPNDDRSLKWGHGQPEAADPGAKDSCQPIAEEFEFSWLRSPRQITEHLDEHVIGQERAKRNLAVAVFHHLNRVKANFATLAKEQQSQQPDAVELDEPTSDTFDRHRAFLNKEDWQPRRPVDTNTTSWNLKDSDSPKLFETGHQSSPRKPVIPPKGYPSKRNIEPDFFLRRQQLAEGVQEPMSQPVCSGDSYVDNAAKSTYVVSPRISGLSNQPSITRPSGVRELNTSLQRPVDEKPARGVGNGVIFDKANVLLVGPTGSGKTLLARTLAKMLKVPFTMADATPFTQAGYVGEDVDVVIQRLLAAAEYDVRRAEMGIVFIDEIDKIARRNPIHGLGGKDVSGEGVQQALLKMLEGTVVHVTDKTGAAAAARMAAKARAGGAAPGGPDSGGNTYFPVPGNGSSKGETFAIDTTNILFVLSGAFIGLENIIAERVNKGSIGFEATMKTTAKANGHDGVNYLDMLEPDDLIKFGLIPEFVGRLPILSNVKYLDKEALVRVMTEPKNALLRQLEGQFSWSNVRLRVTQPALMEIAALAITKNTGARGLQAIMHSLLLDAMYETPGSAVRTIVVDRDVVLGKKRVVEFLQGDDEKVDQLVAEDEERYAAMIADESILGEAASAEEATAP